MTITNTANYAGIVTALFVEIDVPVLGALRLSDYIYEDTIGGNAFVPLGRLLSISSGSNDIRSTPGELTISLSGIPNVNIAEFTNNRVKGSAIEVWRKFYNATTLAAIGSEIGRYKGLVTNFGIEEDYDIAGASSTVTIIVTASSTQQVIQNKVSGRRTNPADQNALYPSDLSFDRVLKLSKSNLNWGAPT